MSVKRNTQTQNRRSLKGKGAIVSVSDKKPGQQTAGGSAATDATRCEGETVSNVAGNSVNEHEHTSNQQQPSEVSANQKGVCVTVPPLGVGVRHSEEDKEGRLHVSLLSGSRKEGLEVTEDDTPKHSSTTCGDTLSSYGQAQNDSQVDDTATIHSNERMALSQEGEPHIEQYCDRSDDTKGDPQATPRNFGTTLAAPATDCSASVSPHGEGGKQSLPTEERAFASSPPLPPGKCRGTSEGDGERADRGAVVESRQRGDIHFPTQGMCEVQPCPARERLKPLPVGETCATATTKKENDLQSQKDLLCPGADSLQIATKHCDPPSSHSSSYTFTPEVSLALCQLIDSNVIAPLSKNVEEMALHRRMQLNRLAGYLNDAINNVAWGKGVNYGEKRYYVFGSLASGTVLPDGDNDMTIEVDGLLNPTKIETQSEAHADSSDGAAGSSCSSSISGTSSQATTVAGGELLSSVADYLRENNKSVYVDTVVVAEVRVLKLVMDGSSYDITVGQLGGVSCIRFLHEMDMKIGCNHLLKRTLLLMKAWCCYEAHVLSGQGGYISSYAATVMIISMINTVEFLEDVEREERGGEGDGKHLDERQRGEYQHISPLQLFARFLKYFSYFDFESYCLTLFGPVPCDKINNVPLDLDLVESQVEHFQQPGGSAVFGLTAEGQEALGHCLRRRAKQLITPRELKRMLSQESHRPQRGKAGHLPPCTQANKSHPSSNTPESFTPEAGKEHAVSRGHADDGGRASGPVTTTVNFPLRTMNVMDPLRWGSSVCRGVCRNHLQRIYRAFREGLVLFKMGSAKLAQSLPTSRGPSSGLGSGVTGSVTREPQFSGALGHYLVDAAAYNRCVDMTGHSILHELFGQTLHYVQRYCPEHLPVRPRVALTSCKQCSQPTFFCVPNVQQVLEPQFLFDSQERVLGSNDEFEGRSSQLSTPSDNAYISHPGLGVLKNQQPRQQHPSYHSVKTVPGPLPVSCPPPTTSLSPAAPANPLQHTNCTDGGAWLGGAGSQVHGKPTANSMSTRNQLLRGIPLMRVGFRNVGTLRNHCTAPPAMPLGGTFPYMHDVSPFPCYPTGPGRAPEGAHYSTKKLREDEGFMMNFVPPHLSRGQRFYDPIAPLGQGGM